MSPSADLLRDSSTASRRVVSQPGPSAQALQRSEFEDFMNAYRPTVEVTSFEREPPRHGNQEADSKADFGRSLKKLMKRTQTSSPSLINKNPKKESGIQRVPAPGVKTSPNELKPAPVSHVKKASRPGSVLIAESTVHHAMPSLLPSPPLYPKPATTPPISDVRPTGALLKPEHSLKNGAKTKAERNGATHHQEPPLQVQTHHQKLTAEVLPQPQRASTPSPASIRRKPSLHEAQKEMAMSVPAASQPPTPTCDAHVLLLARSGLGRFLPSRWNPDPLLSLRIVEVPERKYSVILELEESPNLQEPRISNSGMAVVSQDEDNFRKDSWDQLHAFSWIKESRIAISGMLLVNVEKWTEFPYVTCLMVSGGRNELCQRVNQVGSRPLPMDHHQLHFVAGYEEMVAVCRPPITPFPEKPSTASTGFVVFLYQVLPGEDGIRFEQNWVTWTGARQLYMHAPEYMGFKKITILKSVLPTQIVIYAMFCEFTTIMDHLTEACVLIDLLRARCCGFAGIYRVLDTL